jgi:hypothetical protein
MLSQLYDDSCFGGEFTTVMFISMYYRLPSISKWLFLAMLIAPSSSAQAQRSPTVSPKDKSIEDKFRSDEIERVRRSALSAVTRNDRHATRFPQIKEDFERIQVINSDVLQANAFDKGLDYRSISKAAAEIKKRATRLKSNLFPSESNERQRQIEEQTKEPQDLNSLLTELDKAISSFVHNPIFENTRVVNPEDSVKAERDLEKIINLSAKTKKKAE